MNKILPILLSIIVLIFCLNKSYCAYPEYVSSVSQAEREAQEQDKKLLLIFGAEWCKYCVYLKNDLEKQGDQILDNYVVCYVDYDKNKELAQKYNVKSLPYSIIIKGQREIKRLKGYSSFNFYRSWVK